MLPHRDVHWALADTELLSYGLFYVLEVSEYFRWKHRQSLLASQPIDVTSAQDPCSSNRLWALP